MQYQIYWTPQTQLLELQGATVDFREQNEVYYENFFLPSGRVIASWQSQHVSQQQRIADLPQLTRGETYILQRYVDNNDHMFAYLKINFYDEQHRELLTVSQNKDELEFTVPEDYEFYNIELLSAGKGHFVFHEFTIRPKKQGVLRDSDVVIAPWLTSYLEIPETMTSKVLRVVFSEPENNVTDYPTAWIKETQQAVQYIASSAYNEQYYRQYEHEIIDNIKQARKQAHARQVEFVGYGPISSHAALFYQSKFKGSSAVISEDVLLAPCKSLKIERTIDNVSYLSQPISPNYTLPLQVAKPHYERLETLKYDTPTPEEVRRQAEYDAAHPKRGLFSKMLS